MKKTNFFIFIAILLTLNTSLQSWTHTFTNTTDGKVTVYLYPEKGILGSWSKEILPGRTEDIGVGGYCIRKVYVTGDAGPIAGLNATFWREYSQSGGICTGDNYTIVATGKKTSSSGGQANVQNANITNVTVGGNKQYDPNTSINYQNYPYNLDNGELIINRLTY